MSWKYFLHNSTQNLTAGIKEDQFSHDSEGAGLILNEIGSILKDFHLEDQDSDINAESIQLTFNCSQNCMQVSYNFIHIKLNIQLRTQSITTMLDHIAEEQKYLTGIFFFFFCSRSVPHSQCSQPSQFKDAWLMKPKRISEIHLQQSQDQCLWGIMSEHTVGLFLLLQEHTH